MQEDVNAASEYVQNRNNNTPPPINPENLKSILQKLQEQWKNINKTLKKRDIGRWQVRQLTPDQQARAIFAGDIVLRIVNSLTERPTANNLSDFMHEIKKDSKTLSKTSTPPIEMEQFLSSAEKGARTYFVQGSRPPQHYLNYLSMQAELIIWMIRTFAEDVDIQDIRDMDIQEGIRMSGGNERDPGKLLAICAGVVVTVTASIVGSLHSIQKK